VEDPWEQFFNFFIMRIGPVLLFCISSFYCLFY